MNKQTILTGTMYMTIVILFLTMIYLSLEPCSFTEQQNICEQLKTNIK